MAKTTKISIEQANKLLQTLISDVEVVEDKEADKDADLEVIETGINENVKASVRPDIEAELKDKANSSVVGKFINSLRSEVARTFGVSKKDLEDKELADIIKTAKTTYDASASKPNETWQEEREQLIKEHEEALTELSNQKDGEIAEWGKKYSSFHISQQAQKITESIPRQKGKVSDHAEYLLFKAQKDGYEVKYDETKGKLSFWKEGKEHRDGNKEFDISKYAQSVFDDAGISVKDARHINPADVKKGTDTSITPLEKMPDLEHIPENIRELMAGIQE